MSSWVAPAVAAEIWGLSLEEVMRHIANGTVPSRTDGRFLFVDVAALAMPAVPPAPDADDLVSQQELMALASPAASAADLPPDISQWREARCRTSHQRRPPAAGEGAA